MICPDLAVLEARPWLVATRTHVADCGSCRLVMELIDERSQAAESRDRRAECVRFEALIAVRVAGGLRGPAAAMLDEHVRGCADCRAVSDTLAPTSDVASDHSTLRAIDSSDYALGPEVARGGMGRIVSARDLRIGRPVAVKELLAKTATLAARFEREARVTARLQHPGIIPIYEIGRWESGTPFYAMRMVAGRTLRSALTNKTLEARLALLPSVIAAAEAVAFAHAHDVIHRDLTPANIMVGDYGETVVIDWGLAKDVAEPDDVDAGPYRREPESSAEITAAGAIIGTAAYMPPEQARGERVDARADVYALGAILYHLLSGQAPFKGNSDDVLRRVKSEAPGPLPATAPRDLASIATKAMAKSPDDRYPSAKELAAELTAFQAGRLVASHDYTRGDLIRRWMRKRRGILAVVAIAAIALGVFGVFAVQRIVDERDVADQQRVVAEVQRTQSQALSTTLLVEQGRQELLAGKHARAAALLAEAYRAAPDDFVIKQLLGTAMRTLEATERLQPPSSVVSPDVLNDGRIEVSPDGKRYLAKLDRLWLSDAKAKAPIIALDERDAARWPHFSPDSKYVGGASDTAVRVWDAATGKRLHDIPLGRQISWVGFSRDSAHVIALANDGGWGAWAVASGTRIRFVEPPDKVGVAPQGTNARPGMNHAAGVIDELFPVVMADGKVIVWDWQRGAVVQRFEHGAEIPTPFSSAFDGTTLVTCGMDGRIKRWDARTGKLLATLIETSGAIATCSLSSTGSIAASSMTGGIRVWSPAGAPLFFVVDEFAVVRFSPDGQYLLIQHGSRETILRDAATGTVMLQLGISAVLSANRDHVFLLRPDGAVDTLRLRHLGFVRELPGYARAGIEVDRDARTMLVDEEDGRVVHHDLEHDRQTVLPITRPHSIGKDHVVGWGSRGITIVRATGEIVREIALAQAPRHVALSDDDRQVVAKLDDGKVVVWEVSTGREIASLAKDAHELVGLDHGRVLLLTDFGPSAFWDPKTDRHTKISDVSWQVEMTDDGALMSVSDGDFTTVVDTHSGERKLVAVGRFATFDQAGSVFVRLEDEVTRWSTTTWQRTGSIQLPSGTTAGKITAHPSGLFIATSSGIWETRSGTQIAAFDRGLPVLRVEGGSMVADIDWVKFSERGDELRIQTSTGGRIWNVRPETRSADEVSAIVASRQPWRVIGGKLTLPRSNTARPVTWVRGRVLYRGAPVAGAKVFESGAMDRQVATTDAAGRFEGARVPGKHMMIAISDQHGAFGNSELIASETPVGVDIALQYEGSIAGRVIDRSGRPHAHAHVVAEGEDDKGEAPTDQAGRFRIVTLSGGKTYGMKVIDRRTGRPIPSAPLPRPHLATATSHVEGIEIVVDDDPVVSEARLETSVFHRLTPRGQPGRAVDVVNEGDASTKLDIRASGPYPGQLWKLTQIGSTYRLTTQWQGDDKRLGFDGDRPLLVKGGTQTWDLARAADGSYRVKPVGDPRCLAGGLRFALVPCADTTEQAWLITPTTARTTK